MKRHILHITLFLVALTINNYSWGQTTLTLPTSSDIALDGNYILSSDLTFTKNYRYVINSGKNVVLVLNGKTIDGDSKLTKSMFNIKEGGTLTIKGNGTLKNGKDNSSTGGGCIYVAGTLNLQGGTITNCQATNDGGAVYVASSGTLNLQGGTITNCQATSDGGAVYVASSGTLNMSDGTISNNIAGTYGAGVYTSGEFNMTGGLIDNNRVNVYKNLNLPADNDLPIGKSDDTCYGGGVYVTGDKGDFVMENGIISSNVAVSGGGVFVSSGANFTMSGGEIKGNYAAASSYSRGNGGAIYVRSSTCELKGGILSDNKASRYGGAVNTNGSELKVTNCKIIQNYASCGGGLAQESGSCDMTINNSVLNGNVAKASGGGIFIEQGTLTVYNSQIENNKAEGTCTKKAADYNGIGGGVYLEKYRVDGAITTTIQNHSIISGNYAFKRGGGIGLMATSSTSGNITVNFESGNLVNNFTDGDGAGINLYTTQNNNNRFKMTVGTEQFIPLIAGNIATNQGGGIAMSRGTFTIVNADFKNNRAASGGGIYLNNGTFNVTGTTNIHGNEATTGNGGGIFLGAGTFTVADNGVLNVGNENFSNKATLGNGGGIYCKTTFTVNGRAIIKNNQALNGGGVCVENGTVTLAAGKDSYISTNKADNYGGGLYVYNSSNSKQTANFNGGTFTDNNANAGGAVCVNGNITLNLTATMDGNTALNGGAIYMQGGVLMNFGEGLIRNNHAVKKSDIGNTSARDLTVDNEYGGIGGGVFMSTNSKLTFTAPKLLGIYNNKADNVAADIFANGNQTEITNLPTTKDMSLNGYDVPGDLYWAEDYVNGEILENGKTGIRYQDALKDMAEVVNVDFSGAETKRLYNTYSCLEIGYHLVLMNLICEGLLEGDDAGILISYTKNEVEKLYRRVLFTGTGSKLSKEIALPAFEWKFAASDWNNSKYKISYIPESSNEEYTIMNLQYGDIGKEVIIKYTPLESGESLTKFYNRVVNYMKPL